jgi:hypothetical protein
VTASLAVLDESRVLVPRLVAPSKKVTVPVGVPTPAGIGETTAVNVIKLPKADGFADDETTVTVASATPVPESEIVIAG